MYIGIGLVAGFVSGLLGIGGGLVMVPMLAGWLGMPLKRALGTSLLAIVALVIPGTITHAVLGHIDWAVVLVVTVGAVPGARLGAQIALGSAGANAPPARRRLPARRRRRLRRLGGDRAARR